MTGERHTVISPYVPESAEIVDRKCVTDDETWYKLRFLSGRQLGQMPGQFVQVSIPGVGEAPISVTSPPSMSDGFELYIRHVGDVTRAIERLGVGDVLGIRGPFGTGFDLTAVRGRDLLFVAGGLGLVPLRPVIQTALEARDQYGRLIILYGTRSPDTILYREELDRWKADDSVECYITVDTADDTWQGHVGLVTELFRQVPLDGHNTGAFICGPDVMFHYVLAEARAAGIRDEMIFLSLERRMRCGVGKCGHCQEGPFFVCRDGPCFSYARLQSQMVRERSE